MKNLMNICKMLPVFVLLVLGACKEKSADPEPETPTITMTEVADYYFVAEKKTGQRLMILYFTKDGNTVTANAHVQRGLRRPEVTIENSRLRMDYNSDGTSIYTFDLEKDAGGNIKLKSYDQVLNGVANQLSFAIIGKKAEADPFLITNIYKTGSSAFRFSFKTELTSVTKYFHWIDKQQYPYYDLDNIGFKTNQDELLGVSVPYWNGVNSPVALIEQGDAIFVGTKQ